MRKIIKELNLYIGIGSGLVTFGAYFDKKRKLKDIIAATEAEKFQKDKEISEIEVQKNIDLSQVKKMIQDACSELQKGAEYYTKAETEKKVNGDSEAYQYYLQKYKDAQERIVKFQDDIDKYIEEARKSKFIMKDWYENFKEYLSTLSLDQTFALLHIIFFITMLFLVYNIIIIFYSDLIIKYFSIEKKYPSFARFIELRRKFQSYYMTWNLIILLLILLFLLIINLLVFLNII